MPRTPAKKYQRFRSVCFTAWKGEAKKLMAKADEAPIKYLCYGNEKCPNTGKAHEQGFVMFSRQLTFNQVIKVLGREVNFEKIKGSPQQNIDYCSKEGDFHEYGTRPKQGKRHDLDELRDLILNGKKSVEDIMLEQPIMYHQYGRTLNKIEDVYLRKKKRTTMTKGIWIYGPTGVGKSHKAYDLAGDSCYTWPNDGRWWDAYRGQDTVVINDFRGQIRYGELLDLVDKWEKTVPRRNREPLPFVAKTVIITSSMHPRDVYAYLSMKKKDKLDQLFRRFNIIEMTEREDGTPTGEEVRCYPPTTSE